MSLWFDFGFSLVIVFVFHCFLCSVAMMVDWCIAVHHHGRGDEDKLRERMEDDRVLMPW